MGLVGCVALLAGGLIWLNAAPRSITFDDGYFYFQTAQHLASGRGLTFDGLHTTNGFHFLWLLLLVPTFWLTKSPEVTHLIGYWLQASLFAAGAIVLYQISRRYWGRVPSALAVLAWIQATYWLQLSGLEYALHSLGLLTLTFLYQRRFGNSLPSNIRPYLWLGLVAGFTFLARLDTLVMAGLVGLHLLWRLHQQKSQLSLLIFYGLPIGLAMAGYLLINWLTVGQIMTVSSVIKGDWSSYLLAEDVVYQRGGWLGAKGWHAFWPLRKVATVYDGLFAFGVYGVGVVWLGRWLPGRTHPLYPLNHPLTPLTLYSLSHFTLSILVYHDNVGASPWYYPTPLILACLSLAALLHNIRQKHTQIYLSLLLLLGSGLAVDLTRQLRQHNQSATRVLPILEAVEQLPSDSILASWNPGAISYLTQRTVIPLDGLVNSWEYYHTQRLDLCTYWQAEQVDYLVDVFAKDAQGYPTPIYPAHPAYKEFAPCADQLRQVWSDNNNVETTFRMEIYAITSQN